MGAPVVVPFRQGLSAAPAGAPKALKGLLGGKGAGLVKMSSLGLRVPPGFVITTATCAKYASAHGQLPDDVWEQILGAVRDLEEHTGTALGGATPLLLSVRSGAAVSMPGMMDTVLNLGLTPVAIEALEATRGARFAADVVRRFLDMFGEVVLGISHDAFEAELASIKAAKCVERDDQLDGEDLAELVRRYRGVWKSNGVDPDAMLADPHEQLRRAVCAVFTSWGNERAVTYRRVQGITGLVGTAVNVQQMAFGNADDKSGSGVLFTRNPSDGTPKMYGEHLWCAQGEDVVAGIRTPLSLEEMAQSAPEVYRELEGVCATLESEYRDMMDVEFTIESGTLYVLQCRSGKRTGAAAVKIACDLEREGLVDRKAALLLVEPKHVETVLHPTFADEEAYKASVLAVGLPASPGAAVGKIVFDAAAAVASSDPVILVRVETSAEDVGGMHAACGIVTCRGGMTSHAAVVARGWGKCAVVGATTLSVDYTAGTLKVASDPSQDADILREGDWLSVNGTTGEVIAGKQPLQDPKIESGDLKQILEWADAFRKLRVLANADEPEDARTARKLGAEGVGLCRTEHMFFATEERLRAMRKLILAEDDDERDRALLELKGFQKADFQGLFQELDGLPVTVRLLDPPLHEFLPQLSDADEIVRIAEATGHSESTIRRHIVELSETNPMLGFRGCRLAIVWPQIAEMQTEAILEGAIDAHVAGAKNVMPSIMVPLVSCEEEQATVARLIRKTAWHVFQDKGTAIKFDVGCMIELPRAALRAGDLARHAEFFSFGTNDLTQLTFGFSRDDVGKFVPAYKKQAILASDPFATLDQTGVGELISIACTRARAANPRIGLGICGEHGGDAASITFIDGVGELDYTSVSPYRVPVARLAAAHAAIERELAS